MKIDDFLKLSYEDLERLTGVHRTAWSHYFNKKRGISERTLAKVCKGLDMGVGDFWVALEAKRRKTSGTRHNKLTHSAS